MTTALDTLSADMALGDADARMLFFNRFLGTELFLLLDAEPEGDKAQPMLFDLSDGSFVAVFDTEARLAEFAEGVRPYLALSGRGLVEMLLGAGLGIALNPAVSENAALISSGEISWLSGLQAEAKEVSGHPEELLPPHGAGETLISALDAKLSGFAGMADAAYLAGARYKGGKEGLILAVLEPRQGAEQPIADAIAETAVLGGAALDVIFIERVDPIAARFAAVALRFDIPEPPKPKEMAAPGSDPSKPPILK